MKRARNTIQYRSARDDCIEFNSPWTSHIDVIMDMQLMHEFPLNYTGHEHALSSHYELFPMTLMYNQKDQQQLSWY